MTLLDGPHTNVSAELLEAFPWVEVDMFGDADGKDGPDAADVFCDGCGGSECSTCPAWLICGYTDSTILKMCGRCETNAAGRCHGERLKACLELHDAIEARLDREALLAGLHP